MRYGSRYPPSTCPNYFLGEPRPVFLSITWKVHFTRGVFGVYRLRHAGAQPQLSALPDPQPTQKIEIKTRDHSENPPESPLDPDVHPVVVKIAKINILGRFGSKNGPRMVSESVRL